MESSYKPSLRHYTELQEIIGYRFKNESLLRDALIHTSFANETRKARKELKDNERLEFLGDSVLSLITAEYLFSLKSNLNEGDLTKIRAAVVCEDSLFGFSGKIHLGDFILLGHGEVLTHGRNRKSIVADAFEALLAAIYLDGGFESAKKFLLPFITEGVNTTVKQGSHDYKSILQRIVQQTPEEILAYKLISEEGPPHDKTFSITVYLNSNVLGHGVGKSKREAEQAAAREGLKALGQNV